MPSQSQVTGLLLEWCRGNESALEKLIPLVHSELHRLAHRYLAGERKGHTLQTTALVNEVYLKLVDCRRVNWQDRSHFLALSATLIRRVLVDYARSKRSRKRGGNALRVTLEEGSAVSRQRLTDWLLLDELLEGLAKVDKRKSQVIELRFFGGLSIEETARYLRVSEDTVIRDWKLAKAWLLNEIAGCD